MLGVAILIDAATPVMASLRGNAAPLHVEHLPERFALLVILVLGEAVAGLALAVHNADWAWRSLTLAAAAFVAVAALWWNYFDAGTPLGEDNLEDLEEEAEHTAPREEDTSHPDAGPTGGWPVVRARLQEDLFVYGHLPVTFGIAAAAVGLEEMALHPQDRPAAASWVLVGGLVLFYAGMTAIVAGTGGSWRQAWPWPGCAAFLVPPIAFWAAAPGVVASAVAVTVVLAVGGTAMQRRRSRTTGAEPERSAA